MGKLVVVAGASGAGKSFLLENAVSIIPRVSIIKKLTTRKARSYETDDSGDLIFDCTKEEILDCKYTYLYSTKTTSHTYGIRKADIDKALKLNRYPIVIVRNCEKIIQIKQDYPTCLVIYLQSILSGQDLENKLIELGRDDIDLSERVERIHRDLNDYITHYRHDLFDEVIINNYTIEGLHHQLSAVSHRHFADNHKKDQIFVIMSFKASLDDSFNAIETACSLVKNRDLKVIRIDKQKGDYKITEKIIQFIEESELIICDLTEERPNVYWELGYARGLGKKVINIAANDSQLHFDIKDFNTHFYRSPMKLKDILVQQLDAFFNGDTI